MDDKNLAKFNEYQQYKRDRARRDELYDVLYELNKQKDFIDKAIAKYTTELYAVCDRITEFEQGNQTVDMEDDLEQ